MGYRLELGRVEQVGILDLEFALAGRIATQANDLICHGAILASSATRHIVRKGKRAIERAMGRAVAPLVPGAPHAPIHFGIHRGLLVHFRRIALLLGDLRLQAELLVLLIGGLVADV